MKKRYKALKVRIYPTTHQRTLIDKTLGSCRALYNMMLHERIAFFEENKDDRRVINGHKYKTEKEYKVEFAWMKEVDADGRIKARHGFLLPHWQAFCINSF